MEAHLTEEQVREQVMLGMIVTEVMGMEGDIKAIWNPNDAVELEEARNQFSRLTKDKKFRAYKVQDNGEKGEPMNAFEASSGRIIYVPPFQGG